MNAENWYKRIFSISPPECKQDFYNDGLGEIAIGVTLSMLFIATWIGWLNRDEWGAILFFTIYISAIVFPGLLSISIIRNIRRRLWQMSDAVKNYYKSIQVRKFDFVGFLLMACIPLIFMVLLMMFSWKLDGVRYYRAMTQSGAMFTMWGIRYAYTNRKWRYAGIGMLGQVLSFMVTLLYPDDGLQQLAVQFLIAGVGLLFMGLFQFVRFLKKTLLAE